METWISVPGYEGRYEVSDLGRVRSLRDGRILKPQTDKDGYQRTTLCVNAQARRFLAHHLVLEAFGFPRPEGMQVRHLNGVPADNRLANLRWGTAAENYADRRVHGTDNSGQRNGRSQTNRERLCPTT